MVRRPETPRSRQATPRFHRASAQVRREALVEATLACLRRYGHEGMSVRRISRQAGVSAGLINHHFPSITTLVAAAYQTLADSLLRSMRRHAQDPDLTPRQRLHRYFEASFAPDQIDPGVFHCWLVFWSRIAHDDEMRAVHERTYGDYRAVLEQLLGELQPAASAHFRLREAATALGALMDGLWLEASVFPGRFKAASAVRLCDDWVSALCDGALPGLRASAQRLQRERP
ncbi:MAG: TetR family transcriptional regulator C-terminal domain-containing protein [Proteobacteria bacterium]|nr:TetR family transcriptional regulator C-terminal domain-containing protein [Pseudomonadota bacterium]